MLSGHPGRSMVKIAYLSENLQSIYMMKRMIISCVLSVLTLLVLNVYSQQEQAEFSFVFMTDIHVQPERNAGAGFTVAINKVNELNPDFVITGGDLVMDCLGQSYGRADSLYDLYLSLSGNFRMPVYNGMGNHEIYGWYAESKADRAHPEFGKKMFESRIGPRYRTFEHEGWRFIILDSVMEDGKGGYQGGIDQEQIGWLKDLLSQVPVDQPIVISVHIPFLTTEAQILQGSLACNTPGAVITNSKEVLDLFQHHQLKLVLQGHLHYYETMHVFGTDYITGGSVAAAWWKGPYLGTEEGFLMLNVKGDEVNWDYIDYGWTIKD